MIDKKSDKGYWLIQWDGKTIQQITHVGTKKPVLAVIINALYIDHEILSNVINMINESGSLSETKNCNNLCRSQE